MDTGWLCIIWHNDYPDTNPNQPNITNKYVQKHKNLWGCTKSHSIHEKQSPRLPRDVSTEWNSMFDMLTFSLQYREAVDDISGNKTANMHQYELNDEEWQISEQFHNTLKVLFVRVLMELLALTWTCPSATHILKDMTLYFSCSTLTLAMVIPAMDHINEVLTSQSLDSDYEPSICAAFRLEATQLLLFCHWPFRGVLYHDG